MAKRQTYAKRSHVLDRINLHLGLGVPMTSKELLAVCFCHKQTLKVALYKLRDEHQIHISGWERNHAALWLMGAGEDVQRAIGMTDAQKYLSRKKRTPAMERDVIRNRRNAKLRRVKGDPLVNLFFGG